MTNYFANYISDIKDYLNNMIVTDRNKTIIDNEIGLEMWVEKAKEIRDSKKGRFFFAGNGASATMAEHLSHDCFQNADMVTVTCAETSHITAISNDISYEDVFAYKIGKMMDNRDMLITISSSGNSPNIVKAIKTAREKNMFIVTISGMKKDNKSRMSGDLNFYVPALTYGMVESCHATLLHCWLDQFLDKYMGGRH
ncbi:SIS domain-containing protein [Lachnoclostridium edouardi]|uniref:SIS domain-containing protein n=1 Tax=Lachnoclostridium edouardi TaxID=1926283 RepID=UPI000C7CA34B|nr:SIS domain-containing protein [Lachnoclostridium edouardi]